MSIKKIRKTEITGQNIYAFIWDKDGNICYPAGETFETYGTSSRDASDYAITLTELAVGFYTGTWPSFVERGNYDVVCRLRDGTTAADSDYNISDPTETYWTGAAITEEPETNAVNICNRALLKIGGGKEGSYPITSLGDGEGGTSDNCDLVYTPVRKEVLKRIKPQECTYYDEFEASSYSGEMGEWEYVFDLPDDCLIVTKMIDESDHTKEYRKDIKHGYLFSNDYSNNDGDAAFCEYIKNETDGEALSEEVVEAMVTKIASCLAPIEVGGELGWQTSRSLAREYENLVLPKAKGINQSMQNDNEKTDKDTNHYSWLGGRS